MRVTVNLHASLMKFVPPGSTGRTAVLEMHDGATVADVVNRLGIPAGRTQMIVSGDEQLELTAALHDGQEVNLFPPLAGGVGR